MLFVKYIVQRSKDHVPPIEINLINKHKLIQIKDYNQLRNLARQV